MSDEKMVSVPESVLRRWNDNAGYMEPEDFQHELRSYLPPEKPEWCLETTGYKLRIMGSGREDEFVASVFHEKGLAAAHVGATRSQIEGLRGTCTEILGDGGPVEYRPLTGDHVWREIEGHVRGTHSFCESRGSEYLARNRKYVELTPEVKRRLDASLPVEPKRGEPVPFTVGLSTLYGHFSYLVPKDRVRDARAALEAGAPVTNNKGE